MEIIDVAENRSRDRKDHIAKNLGIACSTLCTILKNKTKIREQFLEGGNSSAFRKSRKSPYEDVDKCTSEWFVACRRKNIPLSGPPIKAQARKFALKLGHPDFQASNRWLELFRRRHNFPCKTVCGEAASVQDNIIKTWEEEALPKLIEGYDRKNVFNADESGLFFKALPSKTITMAGERCSGGKKSNERVTILPIANWEGTEKETLIVIGKSAKPRCFKNVSTLPVT